MKVWVTMSNEKLSYESPIVSDLGDLRALTAQSKMTVGDDQEGIGNDGNNES